jgi:putative endonuclease
MVRRRSEVVMSGYARSRKARQETMFYVYFLKSLKNGDLYIGSTENIDKRLAEHNSGKTKSTNFYRPWELLDYEEYESRSEAVKKEKFFKSHQQRNILKQKYMAA